MSERRVGPVEGNHMWGVPVNTVEACQERIERLLVREAAASAAGEPGKYELALDDARRELAEALKREASN